MFLVLPFFHASKHLHALLSCIFYLNNAMRHLWKHILALWYASQDDVFMYFKVPVSLFSMSCQTCYLKCHEVMKKIRATMSDMLPQVP